jgi:hypothetical protein
VATVVGFGSPVHLLDSVGHRNDMGPHDDGVDRLEQPADRGERWQVLLHERALLFDDAA